MTPVQRREGHIALAMLPVGLAVLIVSALALLFVVALGLDMALRRPAAWAWPALWSTFAAAIALWNMRTGIAMMSAFDWRPLPFAVLRSAAVVAGWLALP